MQGETTYTVTRRRVLASGAAVAGALALGASGGRVAWAASTDGPAVAGCAGDVQSVLNLGLTLERLAVTFYYTGLTTPAVRDAIGRDPASSLALRAALAEEALHVRLFTDFGAASTPSAFYFPVTTFNGPGYTSRPATFLGVLDRLETGFVAAYLAGVGRLGALGHTDLALLLARTLAVESEHRALGRVIAGDDPVNNLTLEVAAPTCLDAAAVGLAPYLTGIGFHHGATAAIPLPSAAAVARVAGPGRGL